MPDAQTPQLLLVDASSFIARARAPRQARVARTEQPAESMPLVFERPKPPVPKPADSHRASLERSMARLRARMERSTGRAPVLATQEPEGVEPAVFVSRRKLTGSLKSSLIRELADRLGADVRSQSVDLREGSDRLTATFDAKTLTVQLTTRAARDRWVPLVRQFCREHELVEPE